MSWNYRVCKQRHHFRFGEKRKKRVETIFSIREVYYDKKGKVNGWTVEAIRLDGFESPQDLVSTLKLMLSDAEKRKVLSLGVLKT